MGISRSLADDGTTWTVEFDAPYQGLFTRDLPTTVPDGYLPNILNMNLPSGVPKVVDGSTLFATGMTLSGTPTLFGVWYNSSGTPTYLGANTTGEVYAWNGSSWVYLRRGLSTSTTWWSKTPIGKYLVIANKNDGIWKYDGTRLLPLGAKHIAGMESGESWNNSSADTINVKQGTQSLKVTSTGTMVQASYSFSAISAVNGIGPTARQYTSSDLIHFFVYIDDVTKLDTVNTAILLETSPNNFFQRTAAGWGSLSNGWNEISVAKSVFSVGGGSPSWSSLTAVHFRVNATVANTINCSFDDLYLIYAVTMPACQIVLGFKNMLIGLNDTSDSSNVNYSRVSAPDDWDQLASFPVAYGDGASIVGGRVFFDQVVVMKDTSVHSLYVTASGTTYPAYRFAQTPITYAYGCASHRSIVEAKGILYWWTSRDIVQYDGSTVQKMSQGIDPTVTPEPTRLVYITGAFHRAENQVWWSYTPSGGSANTAVLVFDTVLTGFLRSTGQTLPFLLNVISSGQDLLLSMTSAGRVLRQGSGTDFDGSAIAASLTLPWISGPNEGQMVRWHEALVQFANGTGQITVQYRTANHPREMAGASFADAQTATLSSSTEQGRVFLGAHSRWLQLQIVNVSGAVFQLLPPLRVTGTVLPQRY